MLKLTTAATELVLRHGVLVDRYQVLPQLNGSGFEVVDLVECAVIGPAFAQQHSAQSFATEHNLSGDVITVTR